MTSQPLSYDLNTAITALSRAMPFFLLYFSFLLISLVLALHGYVSREMVQRRYCRFTQGAKPRPYLLAPPGTRSQEKYYLINDRRLRGGRLDGFVSFRPGDLVRLRYISASYHSC